jgi:hypothetical protein
MSAIISAKIQPHDCRENSFKKLIAGSGYYAMMESNFLATDRREGGIRRNFRLILSTRAFSCAYFSAA